jgi:adenine-specific DNA-methyltransferase
MGTKRALVPVVSEVIQRAQPGTLLDAFSGMCSVGEAVGASRQVWNNDVQIFASEVAKALFTSCHTPLSPLSCGDIHFPNFQRQKRLLSRQFPKSLAAERKLLLSETFSQFGHHLTVLHQSLALETKRCTLNSAHLFATTYAGTYFGIKQAIEADSLVSSIQKSHSRKEITSDQLRWCFIALGRALLKTANSTGHFAQYLTPKSNNFQRHLTLRRRALWAEWLTSLADLAPVGERDWRKHNKAFNQDTLSLIPRLARTKADLSVIYADPPYTDDQYSRFYHLLDTLILYDYPAVTGAGLYRPDRFQTPFSIKSKAPAALERLIEASARTGADLVLSYPTNGLASAAGADIRAILRKYFRRVEISRTVQHLHSTFGASKGHAQAPVTELIYLARSA